jgi:hypothetical protein
MAGAGKLVCCFGSTAILAMKPGVPFLLGAVMVFAMSAITQGAEDAAAKAFQDAKKYAREGDYAKALERHEWYHKNALSVSRGQYGVRLSFALTNWKRLGEKYPPALASLKAIRDEGAAAVKEGTASVDLFHDVFAINRTLGEEKATVALFKHLHANHPGLARQCSLVARGLLLAQEEDELFLHYVNDLPAYMEVEIDRHKRTVGFLKSRQEPGRESTLKRFDDEIVDTALHLIRLAEKSDPAAAARIREMTFKEIPDPRLQGKE